MMVGVEILILSSVFMCLILISSLLIILSMRRQMIDRDKMYKEGFKKMQDELADIKQIFRNEIGDIFTHFKNIRL